MNGSTGKLRDQLVARQFSTYDLLHEFIDEYFDNKRAFVAPQYSSKRDPAPGADDMEVDAYFKGAGSKGKGKGKSKSKGKTKSKGGKKGKSKSKTPSTPFAGYCDGCGKWGHKKNDCWYSGAGAGKPSDINAQDQDQWEYWEDPAEQQQPPRPTAKAAAKASAAGSSSTGGIGALAAILEDTTLADDSWMMALLVDDGDDEDVLIASLGTQNRPQYGLLDSGSAVTSGPRSFGSQFALKTDGPRHRLTAVNGGNIPHYGQREVPCGITMSDGSEQKALLQTEVADVNKVVLSVSSLRAKGTGTWFPPDDGKQYWLLDDEGQTTLLPGSCLVRNGATAPVLEQRGVFWLPLKPLQPTTSKVTRKHPLLVAPVDDEESFQRMMEDFAPEDHEVPPPDGDEADELPLGEDAPGIGEPVIVTSMPAPPSDAKVAAHKASGHTDYAPWCEHCVKGRGREGGHFRIADDKDMPRLFFDYGFLTEGGQLVDEMKLNEIVDSKKVVTFLAAFDSRSGSLCATQVTSKGGVDKYAIKKLARWIDRLGYKKCMIATDNENAVKVFARRVKANCSADVSLRTRPKGSPASLGGGETAVQIIAGGVRTCMSELEQRIGQRVPVTCNAIPWMVSHVAFCRSRFNRASDNSTPYFRVNGNHYSGAMTNFGDAVLLKTYESDSKLRSRWKKGVWLGKSEFNDSAFVSTNTGVVSGRSFKVLPPEELTSEMILKLVGVPWEPRDVIGDFNGALAIPDVRVELAAPEAPVHVSDDDRESSSSNSRSPEDGGDAPHRVPVPSSPVLGGAETPIAARTPPPGTPPENAGASSSAAPAAEPAE